MQLYNSMSKSDLTPYPISDFTDAAVLNNLTYQDYYKRLRLLALSMFEWNDLPDTMDGRFLEKALYYYGLACFCDDWRMGWLSLRCIPSNDLNIYEEATKYTAYSINYSREYYRDEIVLVRNNLERIPTDMTIRLFARRLYEAERAIETNIKAQKTPVLIRCDEKQRLTLRNVYQKYDGNEPVIFGDKSLDISGIDVLKTDAPFVAKELEQYKQTVWSEALSFLGINSTPYEKSERLVKDEVNSNNQMVMMSAGVMLATRKKACEEFNKKTGMNISVRIRTYEEYKDLMMFLTPDTEMGQEENAALSDYMSDGNVERFR